MLYPSVKFLLFPLDIVSDIHSIPCVILLQCTRSLFKAIIQAKGKKIMTFREDFMVSREKSQR